MPAPIDRRLLGESRAVRRHLALVGVLAVADATLIVAEAVVLASIVAVLARHGLTPSAIRGRLLMLAAVLGARSLIAGSFELTGRRGAVAVMSELRTRLVRRLLLDGPGRRPGGVSTGELATSSTAGIDALEAYFAGYLPQLVRASVIPVAVLACAIAVDPVAGLILAGTVPLLVVLMILVGKGTLEKTRRRHRALAVLGAHFLDVVSGLETLRSYRRETVQHDTLQRVGDAYRRETLATLRVAFLSALVLELCAMIGTALVAAAIGIELCAGALSLQAGLTVLILAPELYGPLREVGQQFHAGADASGAAERIFAVLDRIPARTGSTANLIAPDPAAAPVVLERVSFRYDSAQPPVLAGLDLALAPGRTVLLRGPSGVGKTTLSRLLLGFEQPESGTISCDGVDLRSVAPEAWRQRIAWLPQDPAVFTASVADNVRLGRPGAGESEVLDALHAAGADPLLAQLPDGIATILGEGGRRLSAGERRRIGLARVILRDAPLLVLDEPTAHLDPAAAADIAARLARVATGRTTLLISHDPQIEPIADEVVDLRTAATNARVDEPAAGAALGLPVIA